MTVKPGASTTDCRINSVDSLDWRLRTDEIRTYLLGSGGWQCLRPFRAFGKEDDRLEKGVIMVAFVRHRPGL